MRVEINTDAYAGDTTWEIKENDSVLMSGGPYESGLTTFSVSQCFDYGSYEFIIYDSFEDGICCEYGKGRYSVFIDKDEVITGGAFDKSETTAFDISESSPNDSPTPFPNDSPTPYPTETAPTPYPTEAAPTSYPTETPPTSYPTQRPPTYFPTPPVSVCKVKGESCENSEECCKRKCHKRKNICKK